MDDSAPSDTSLPAPRYPPFPTAMAPGRRVPLLCLVMAVAAVVVFWGLGFLPWVWDGFRLEGSRYGSGLSELWLPVPLVAGELPVLVALATIGSLGAMVLPMLFPAIPRPLAVVVTALVVIATAVALVSVARVRLADQSLNDFAGDPRVLDGLVVGFLAVILGCVVVGGIAALQPGFLPVPAALVVTQMVSWVALLNLPRPELVVDLSTLVVLAGAFVLSVRNAWGWIAVWPFALGLVWAGPAASAALTVVAGRLRPGENLDESLSDVVGNGLEVFRLALGESPRTWWPGLVAMAIGAAWLAVRRWRTGTQ